MNNCAGRRREGKERRHIISPNQSENKNTFPMLNGNTTLLHTYNQIKLELMERNDPNTDEIHIHKKENPMEII